MKITSAAKILVLCLLVAATCARAEEEEAKDAFGLTEADRAKLSAEDQEILKKREADMAAIQKDLKPENIELFAYFPSNQDFKFPVGELSTVIGGARISESLYGKISCYGVQADIASPYEASAIIQNFTYYEPFHTVMQGKDKTLHLKIMPAKELQARKFQLTVKLMCSYLTTPPESPSEFDKGIGYVNIAFNETCDFIDTTTAFDFDFFLLLFIFAFVVAGLLYVFTDLLSGFTASATSKRKAKAKVETGTVDSNGEEWLQGTFAGTPKKKKK